MKINGTSISMIRGDTETINVSCKDTSGASVPFESGDTIYLTIKTNPREIEKILQKVATEFTDGAAIITFDHDDTKQLKIGTYYYDVQLNRANGTVKTIIPPSNFCIDPEVTYE